MTVDPVKETQYRASRSDLRKLNQVMVSEFAMTTKQAEDDREREGSSENNLYKCSKSGEKVESWTKNIGIVHHQVLKIREEDSHMGKDIGEVLTKKEKLAVFHLNSQMDSFILSRPILPCSPLGGKTAIKTLH